MLTLVIQAGGESRRMGTDKALVPFLGVPLIERVIARLAGLGDELVVTANQPEAYRYLNLPIFSDLLPGRGALGGLYTALHAASQPLVAVVACDMPFANAGLLAAQRDLLLAEGADAVIPRTSGGTEPFHALYRREACLPAVQAALEAAKWRVDAWFPNANIHFLTPEETRLHDSLGIAFWNVNTLDELVRAEQFARQELGEGDSNPA
ncbi:MAG: molybdenum cofactor guanylyltransferase [Anaerolineales bacterium]|nr:molybdenum cofactor guanylyltransferase [Anaerolineales bacterium]